MTHEVLDSPGAGRKVIRGGGLRAGGYLVSIALSIVAAPLLIRHLGVADYGRYLTVISLITIVAGVSEAGLNALGLREHALGDAESGRAALRHLVGLRLTMTVAGVVLAVGFSLAADYTTAQVVGAGLAGLGLALVVVQETYAIPLQTSLRLGWVTAIEVLKQVGTVSAIAALVLADAGLEPFFAVSIFANGLALAVTAVVTRGQGGRAPGFDRAAWWSLVRDTIPFAVATALGIIYFRITIVLLSLVSTEDQVGYFSAAFRIVEVLSGMPWLVVTAVFPILVRAARDDPARLRHAVGRLTQVAALTGAGLAIGLVLGAPFAIAVIAGEDFDPSIAVLRIQAAAVLGTFLLATWGYSLLSVRRYRALLAGNVVALVAAAAVTLALAPYMGARGAAVATVVAEFTLACCYLAALLGGPEDVRLEVRWLPAALLAAAAAIAVPLALGLPALLAALLGGVIYLAVLWVGRAIPPELFEALPFRGRGTA
ncbi:MAG TPA: oligosaccharide flippase family protein [Solirubrobacteraceae bacterium]|nr:oligosaccharide flippase family protein [Solirubrobacteraceae bacterium]